MKCVNLTIALIFTVFFRSLSLAAEQAELRNALTSGRPHDRDAAMKGLLEKGPGAVPALVEVLKTASDDDAKARAGRLLTVLMSNRANRDQAMLDSFEELALSKDQSANDAGINAISAFKHDRRARKMLEGVASRHKDEYARGTALGALLVNSERDKSIIPFMTSSLTDPSEFVQVQAAGYLGMLGNKRGLPGCLSILGRVPSDDKTRGLQMRAAISLGLIGDPTALPILRTVADSAAYGPASWDAKIAIKEIELHQIPARKDQLQYLKISLASRLYSQWAANKLKEIGGADSISILRVAARDSRNPGSEEARIYLSTMGHKID